MGQLLPGIKESASKGRIARVRSSIGWAAQGLAAEKLVLDTTGDFYQEHEGASWLFRVGSFQHALKGGRFGAWARRKSAGKRTHSLRPSVPARDLRPFGVLR